MEFFPVFLRLRGRDVLVVGGGDIAARKVRLLARSGAQIRVMAPALGGELADAVQQGLVRWQAESFSAEALGQPVLVVAATDDAAVNRQVASVAQSRDITVNVVDDASSSSAIMPAIVDRSPIVIALSSGGTAPVLARRLRDRVERMLPASYGNLAELSGTVRRSVREALPDSRSRLRFWERIFDGPIADRALAGDAAQARALIDASLAAADSAAPPAGEVFLVGVGPGDPDLLTLRAHRLMQLADVVLYDRLIPDAIMELVRRDAQRIDVGKRRSRHTLPQDDINALLVRLAREGQRVLRLKGGDPFMFGRGGEEIEHLRAAGIAFQVVPGITAALGCAAYAGIPLTHRDHAQSCVFVTGHPRADGGLDLNWSQLALPNQTVVVYMGLTALATLCERLREAGLADDWPAAVVCDGTRPEQKVICGDLTSLPTLAAAATGDAPGLVIVGAVVRLREALLGG